MVADREGSMAGSYPINHCRFVHAYIPPPGQLPVRIREMIARY
jgi:hypothetical protein